MKKSAEQLRRLEKEVASLRREVERLKARLPAALPGAEELLRRRGIRFSRKISSPDPLLPENRENLVRYYKLMKKYSFRIFMRDLIGRPDSFAVERTWNYCSPATVRRYLDEMLSLDLIRKQQGETFRMVPRHISSFGETLEWFVVEVLRREFQIPADRGFKLLGRDRGGDFDILASAAGNLLYLEVKSSPPKHIEDKEISSFIRRFEILKPRAAIFLVDTQLRLGDKIVPMFCEAMGKMRAEMVDHRKEGVYRFPGPLYAASSKPTLIHNLGYCFEEMYREELL